jgi:hypothetical protein
MWDRLQEMHPKTLSCSYIYKGRGKTLATKFHDIVHDIMETSDAHTPLLLKIKAWHKEQKWSGEPQRSTNVSDFKPVIMPHQHILK